MRCMKNLYPLEEAVKARNTDDDNQIDHDDAPHEQPTDYNEDSLNEQSRSSHRAAVLNQG